MSDLDFRLAADPEFTATDRHAAWVRYETAQWVEAHRARGLQLKHLDEPMKQAVYLELCQGLAPQPKVVAEPAAIPCSAYPCAMKVKPCAYDCRRCAVHCPHRTGLEST